MFHVVLSIYYNADCVVAQALFYFFIQVFQVVFMFEMGKCRKQIDN